MNKDKKDNEKKAKDKKESEAKQLIKINPNPRANANITDDKKQEPSQDKGVGSEITDGEDG